MEGYSLNGLFVVPIVSLNTTVADLPELTPQHLPYFAFRSIFSHFEIIGCVAFSTCSNVVGLHAGGFAAAAEASWLHNRVGFEVGT
jgi:hypothetical protein